MFSAMGERYGQRPHEIGFGFRDPTAAELGRLARESEWHGIPAFPELASAFFAFDMACFAAHSDVLQEEAKQAREG